MIAPCKGLTRLLRRNLQPSKPETLGEPLLLTISVLGPFTCITQHTRPTALRPIRRTTIHKILTNLLNMCEISQFVSFRNR